MSQDQDKTMVLHVASWWGRASADSRTIFCAQNGWREAVWKRDRRDCWYEASATLRPVVTIYPTGEITLGEPRRVR